MGNGDYVTTLESLKNFAYQTYCFKYVLRENNFYGGTEESFLANEFLDKDLMRQTLPAPAFAKYEAMVAA